MAKTISRFMGGISRVEHNTDGTDCRRGDRIGPERQHQVESDDFEGDQESFVEEEVPAGHEAKGVVDPFTGHTNETSRNRVKGCHFSHAVVHEAEETAVGSVGNEQTAGTTTGKTAADTDEEGSADGATDGDELDLTIAQATLKLVGIVRGDAMLDVWAVAIGGLEAFIRVFLFFGVHGCDGQCRVGGLGRCYGYGYQAGGMVQRRATGGKVEEE